MKYIRGVLYCVWGNGNKNLKQLKCWANKKDTNISLGRRTEVAFEYYRLHPNFKLRLIRKLMKVKTYFAPGILNRLIAYTHLHKRIQKYKQIKAVHKISLMYNANCKLYLFINFKNILAAAKNIYMLFFVIKSYKSVCLTFICWAIPMYIYFVNGINCYRISCIAHSCPEPITSMHTTSSL